MRRGGKSKRALSSALRTRSRFSLTAAPGSPMMTSGASTPTCARLMTLASMFRSPSLVAV